MNAPVAWLVRHDGGTATVADHPGRVEAHVGALFERLAATSSFYRERLAATGPGTALDRLGRLPATTRADYCGPIAAEALAGLGCEPFVADRSSGSTARPVLRLCRRTDDLAEQAATERVFRRAGLRPGDHLVCIDVGAASIYDFYQRAARAVGVEQFTFLHLTDDDASAWAALERLAPDAVLTIPSLLARAGERAFGLWREATSPVRSCISIGERIGDDLRRQLHRVWGCRVAAFFGTTETGGFAGECIAENGCHFLPESTVVGLADLDLIDPWTLEGDLLLTTPEIRTQAVVKYRTGDRVRISLAPCICGEPTPRLWPLGRAEEAFVFAGEKFTYAAFLEALRMVEPGLEDVSILVGPPTARPIRLAVHLPERTRVRAAELQAALCEGLFELDSLCRYGMVEIVLEFTDRLPLGRRKGIRLASRP